MLCTHNLSLLRAERAVSYSYWLILLFHKQNDDQIMLSGMLLSMPIHFCHNKVRCLGPSTIAVAMTSSGTCSSFLDLYVGLLLWTAVDSVQSKYMALILNRKNWISTSYSSAWPGPHESSAPSGLSGLSFFRRKLTNWKESFQTVTKHKSIQPSETMYPQFHIPFSSQLVFSTRSSIFVMLSDLWFRQIMLCYVTCSPWFKETEKFPHSNLKPQEFPVANFRTILGYHFNRWMFVIKIWVFPPPVEPVDIGLLLSSNGGMGHVKVGASLTKKTLGTPLIKQTWELFA